MTRLPSQLVLLLAAVLAAGAARGAPSPEPDLENGEEINQTCAGCHGEFGEGGKQGEYPRLAGMPAAFIARQLHLFRDRLRPNMPMLEYVDDRQMPDDDIRDVSAYLAGLSIPSRMPDMPPEAGALERLQMAAKVLNIPRAEGSIETGRRTYARECAVCHGRDGRGSSAKAVPPLTGQYTNYLWRQVAKYRKGIRIHDPEAPEENLIAAFTDAELRDIFAFLSVADDD